MEFLNSKKFILIIIVILVWAGLQSCTPTEYVDKQSPHETKEEMNAKITKEMDAMDRDQEEKLLPEATNFVGIAEMLGCMFAPGNCPIEDRRQEQETER